MKQIADRNGNPHVFSLGRFDDGLWLDDDYLAGLRDTWYEDRQFVFRLRTLS